MRCVFHTQYDLHFASIGYPVFLTQRTCIGRTNASTFCDCLFLDITLEDVKYFKRPRLPVKRTEVLYQKACALCGITPSQNYAKQTVTSRSILMSNCSLSHLTVKPIAISLVVSTFVWFSFCSVTIYMGLKSYIISSRGILVDGQTAGDPAGKPDHT